MIFEVTILGSNSATPAHGRNQTSQLLNINQRYFLIDCGEGTQIQLQKYKIRFNRISHIFISHLHGDHYLGLMGLLSSMHLQRRTEDLTVFGPRGLADIITLQLKYSETVLSYNCEFQEIDSYSVNIIYENENITVETIPLDHRIPCSGFLFREKPHKRRVIKDKLPANFPISGIISLKNGQDVEHEDRLYTIEEFTWPPRRSRSYAYCSDTAYNEKMIDQIMGVNLLYHEATFTEEMRERAAATHHCTAIQAATIATKANVNRLLLGHFSVRYKELTPILQEAQLEFANSALAIEGETFTVEEA